MATITDLSHFVRNTPAVLKPSALELLVQRELAATRWIREELQRRKQIEDALRPWHLEAEYIRAARQRLAFQSPVERLVAEEILRRHQMMRLIEGPMETLRLAAERVAAHNTAMSPGVRGIAFESQKALERLAQQVDGQRRFAEQFSWFERAKLPLRALAEASAGAGQISMEVGALHSSVVATAVGWDRALDRAGTSFVESFERPDWDPTDIPGGALALPSLSVPASHLSTAAFLLDDEVEGAEGLLIVAAQLGEKDEAVIRAVLDAVHPSIWKCLLGAREAVHRVGSDDDAQCSVSLRRAVERTLATAAPIPAVRDHLVKFAPSRANRRITKREQLEFVFRYRKKNPQFLSMVLADVQAADALGEMINGFCHDRDDRLTVAARLSLVQRVQSVLLVVAEEFILIDRSLS
jgi:hypothetical protein